MLKIFFDITTFKKSKDYYEPSYIFLAGYQKKKKRNHPKKSHQQKTFNNYIKVVLTKKGFDENYLIKASPKKVNQKKVPNKFPKLRNKLVKNF